MERNARIVARFGWRGGGGGRRSLLSQPLREEGGRREEERKKGALFALCRLPLSFHSFYYSSRTVELRYTYCSMVKSTKVKILLITKYNSSFYDCLRHSGNSCKLFGADQLYCIGVLLYVRSSNVLKQFLVMGSSERYPLRGSPNLLLIIQPIFSITLCGDQHQFVLVVPQIRVEQDRESPTHKPHSQLFFKPSPLAPTNNSATATRRGRSCWWNCCESLMTVSHNEISDTSHRLARLINSTQPEAFPFPFPLPLPPPFHPPSLPAHSSSSTDDYSHSERRRGREKRERESWN